MNTQIELTDLLAGFAAARDEAAAPHGAARLPVISAQVRRRRVVRTVAASGLAAAAVLGIAVGVYGLTRPDPTPPVQVPTPTVTRAPSPTPTEEPTEKPTEESPRPLGDVTVHPLLPTAEPLLEGVLEGTTSAWSMVTYYDIDVADGGEADHPTVLDLVAPDGSRFEVPTPVPLMAPCDFCGSSAEVGGAPVVSEWLPGTSLAIVTPVFDDVDVARHYQLTDLLTGEVLQSVDAADGEWAHMFFVGDGTSDVLVVRTYPQNDVGGDGVRVFERRRADGSLVAAFDIDPADQIQHFVIDEAGRQVAFEGAGELRVLDLLTFAEVVRLPVPASDSCQADYTGAMEGPGQPLAQAWLDGDSIVLVCGEADEISGTTGEHLWLVDVDGTTIDLGGGHETTGLATLAGRLLLSDQSTWFELRADGTRSDLPMDRTVDPGRFVDGRLVYVDQYGGDGGAAEPTGELIWVDPFTGSRGTLLELVDPGSRMVAAYVPSR